MNHIFLGVWIRNEFGLNEKINSRLLYECYMSKYNCNKDIIGRMGPLFIADVASSIIVKELGEEIRRNYYQK